MARNPQETQTQLNMKIPNKLLSAQCWNVLGIMATANMRALKLHFSNWCVQHRKNMMTDEVWIMTEAMKEAIRVSRILRKRKEKLEGKRKFPDTDSRDNWDRFELRMMTAKSQIDIHVAKLYYYAAELNRVEIKRSLKQLEQ